MKKNISKGQSLFPQGLSLKTKNGYAVLELLFYIAFFAALSLIVIEAMITMSGSFKETSIYAELAQSGSIIERMSREIRQASSINSISANDLTLDTVASKTMEFKFISPDIQLWDNGSNIGNLNSPNIAITALAFTQITTVKGKAVRVSLTLRDNNDIQGRLENFYNTIVLRGDY